MSYGTGFTEHDVVQLKSSKPIPKSDDPVMELIRVWQQRCIDLKLECIWWPSRDQVDRWLRNYGFEVAREGVIRGIKGFSRVLTDDKGTRALAETKEDAIYQMNYIQKVMKVLRHQSESGQTLVREGSEKCYE